MLDILDFPIIHFAYDTLLIMEACPLQLVSLKAILNSFTDSTGLKVNYAKYSIISINISQDMHTAISSGNFSFSSWVITLHLFGATTRHSSTNSARMFAFG
jgi:hypothetical protein